MKNTLIILASFFLASCTKEWNCTHTYTYGFDDYTEEFTNDQTFTGTKSELEDYIELNEIFDPISQRRTVVDCVVSK